MATRHDDFLQRGARVFGLSADTPPMNSAVMETLALPFPILSDPDRSRAIGPLGFADEGDPRSIALSGAVVVTPEGEIAHSVVGRDYADRPDEDELLEVVEGLGLGPVAQGTFDPGEPGPGEKAVALEDIAPYFRGVKFSVLALRRRHRELGPEFAEDTKRYVQMVERYLEAMPAVEERRA